jgi:hypothetical protein
MNGQYLGRLRSSTLSLYMPRHENLSITKPKRASNLGD